MTPLLTSPQTADPTTAPQTSHGTPDRFGHYMRQEKGAEAMLTGLPVTALCGVIFTPTGRAPQGVEPCPACLELRAMAEDLSDLELDI